MLWISIALMLFGFIVSLKASDFFVDNTAAIAKELGISNFIIGLTIIAIGTSLPEFTAAITAVLHNQDGLVLGNIVGSNITNIGLIIGLIAVMSLIKADKIMFATNALIMAFISIIFFFFSANLIVSATEGIVLLILFAFYLLYLTEEKLKPERKHGFEDFLDFIIRLRMIKIIDFYSRGIFAKKITIKKKVGIQLLFAAISLAGVIISAELLVKGAIGLSSELNISTTFIGLTIIAIGTSLPELMVSITAARKSYSEMVIGNIIGSNIVNLAFIFGIATLFRGINISRFSLAFILPFMLVITIVFIFFLGSRKEIRRFEGLILLALYVFFLYYSYVNAALA